MRSRSEKIVEISLDSQGYMLPGAALHPGRGGEEQEEAEEGGDRGGGPEAQARHHPEQEHRPLKQRDQATEVIMRLLELFREK